ncbi:extracellular solute-binding protein [Paenibacillus sacheonensis]|uniref:Extracellular solute-binding protein n=1 Tax=Paenibacillus sacheonensis TaxID=742054 RepID=A0A7X4YMX9_9BACL|nr:extracellular solute-binding protein [Paenibacillus sacheonensis]MBM7564789.1 putative aldouronate transport system substrate-binding protein [Paenibacillus sacheonensis]NBC69338.1 extracellular solute-binding protein [Paenibacillus sacheonensis]
MWNARGKVAATVLTTAMLGSLLAACGNNDNGDTNGSTNGASNGGSDNKPVTLKLLHNWNGSGGGNVEPDMTPIAKAIKEKTGVTVKFEYTKGSEVEKINTIFATQDLPDIYTGPAWGGELDGVIKAAKEDQLVDLTGKLDKYPNLAKEVQKENVPPALYDKAIGGIDGKQYMLFQNQPASDKDAMDWLYGFYVRKDIATKIGVDPQSVKTKDELFNFLKKIKDANLQENGMPVFPLGGFSNGWAVGIGNTMFYGSDYADKGDGTLEHVFFTKPYEDYTLYYRKLISDGLLDPETFTQTDPIAKEKINQGRIAVLAAHYPAILDASKEYVKSHPGSDYIPVGPLERAGAEDNRPVDLGIQGNNVTVITKECKNVDAALKLLDFLASDEGFKLVHYGIEGTDYDMVDGKPVAKKDVFDKFNADTTGKAKKDEGFGIGLESMTGLDRTNTLGGDIWADQERTAAMDSARKILRPNGIQVISAYNAGDFISKSPQWETLKPSMDQIGDVWKEAVFAKSDEAALKVINQLRSQIKKTGYDDAMKFVNDSLKGKEVVKLQMAN